MPDLELSEMVAASTLTGAELFYALQSDLDRKVTTDQIRAGLQPLDATLTALSGLDAESGYLYQSAPDTVIKRVPTASDLAALRTFVRPLGAATSIGGGFFQSDLFRVALGSPDSASVMLVVHARIIDATTPKSGAFYYEVPICMQRDSLEFGGNIPALLVRSHFDGSTGGGATSVSFSQGALSTSAPNVDISLVIQPANFTNPAVHMAAILTAPGDVAVSIL